LYARLYFNVPCHLFSFSSFQPLTYAERHTSAAIQRMGEISTLEDSSRLQTFTV
jgi:hypothetical protein